MGEFALRHVDTFLLVVVGAGCLNVYMHLMFVLGVFESESPVCFDWKKLLFPFGASIAYFLFTWFALGDFSIGLSRWLLLLIGVLGLPAVIAFVVSLVILTRSIFMCEFDVTLLHNLLWCLWLIVPVGVLIGIYEVLRLVGVTVPLTELLC